MNKVPGREEVMEESLRLEGGTKQAEGETDWYAWIRISVYETGALVEAYERGPFKTQDLARQAVKEAKETFAALGPHSDLMKN